MTLSRWHYLTLACAVAIAVALVGCSGQTGQTGRRTGTTGGTGQQQATNLQLDVVDQWARSGHASAVAFAAERPFCAGCHDGKAFSMGESNPEEGRDWIVATDCRACHTGKGPELARSGTASIPAEPSVKAGMGALCMGGCHHSLGAPNPTDQERGAPHHSVQGDVLTGTGAMTIEGVDFASNRKHMAIQNTCVGCHMKAGSNGAPPDHTFKPDFKGCQRKGCHDSDMTDGGTARGDYDGDGSKEKFTEEIKGLEDTLRKAIVEKAGNGATDVKYDRGEVSFGAPGVKVDDKTYQIAYNLLLIENDLSNGIHNPQFAVSVLRESYRSLTGQDAPGDNVK